MSGQKSLTREQLKKLFKNGQIPTEQDYESFIDSTINKEDDGFRKDRNGWTLSPASPADKNIHSGKLLSFKANVNDPAPYFSLETENKEALRLKPFINRQDQNKEHDSEQKGLYFHHNGHLSIGARDDDGHALLVNGFVAMQGRIGTYKGKNSDGNKGKNSREHVPADGTWHTIIENLHNCHAFEIMARTGKLSQGGKRSAGKYAILHACALSTFGVSDKRHWKRLFGRTGIRKTHAFYSSSLLESIFGWCKIDLRWKLEENKTYSLQIRTRSFYDGGVGIFYTITHLWEDDLIMPEEYYRKVNHL